MTQAYNLAILANAVDTSGKLNVGTNATGTLPVANGGSGQSTYTDGQLLIGNSTGNTLTKSTLTAGSGISITNGAGSISIAATGGGTVTSVATGNGLSGGTITTSGTLTIACPSWNSIGSYAITATQVSISAPGVTAAGGSNVVNTFVPGRMGATGPCGTIQWDASGSMSGTWRWMQGDYNNGNAKLGLVCRVS